MPMKLTQTMKWRHVLAVTFQGAFPIDMLRYESAFPCREIDSGRIEQARFSSGPQTVYIAKYSPEKTPRWEEGRWNSFQCRIQIREEWPSQDD